MEKSQKEVEETFNNDPKNWKFGGLFYYSKIDKRFIVDKSNPNYGTTLNFAHPKSYLMLLIAFLFFGFVLYMITKNQ
ncbi:hypothetical protein [Flavobacterium sp.]|uniref:hypothetical protein n=1 Tax=Flavobacterium sp. TaxID=239 RepID=UPI0024871669|nr:hypothetical protein [Flavobacterium sp.]MDI1318493.1 hypothetical protein [Flavobacterium sp.]